MLQVLVKLTVRDFDALERFESQALAIMREYRGELLTAFEVQPSDGPGDAEVHVLQFPDKASFDRYRADPRLHKLAELRGQAIAQTEISLSKRLKRY